MSALAASVERPAPADRRPQEEYVRAALDTLGSRARGAPSQVTTPGGTVLGARETWPDLPPEERLAVSHAGDATVALAVSGSIDNLPHLGDGPPARRGPARLLLDAYLAHGPAFVERVGGSFAIVIQDDRHGRTLAVRDRLGIEPLYVWARPGLRRVLFASEPKAVLLDPEFPRCFGPANLIDLLNSTSRIPGTTVYRDLREVRPGEILTVDAHGLRTQRYWSPPFSGCAEDVGDIGGVGGPDGGHGLAERVRELTVSAVARRLATDARRQGFLLSGGLDSSIICSAARHTVGAAAPLPTFSFAYEDAERDFTPDPLHVSIDAPYVDLMARHVRAEHTHIGVPQADHLALLERTVRARDLPGVGDLDIGLLRLLDAVSGTQHEVFSGEGADDVFGGYPWFAAQWEAPAPGFPWLQGTASLGILSPEVRDILSVERELDRRWHAVESELAVLPPGHPRQRHMDRVYYMELTRFLPFLLDRADRMSAAAGLRVQLPFTDHRLVEAVWQIPHDVKSSYAVTTEVESDVATGVERGVGDGIEKGLLRTAFAAALPAQITGRRKSGFAVGQSPRYRDAVRQYARQALTDPSSPVAALIDAGYLRGALDGDAWADGRFSGPPLLPRLVMLDLWARIYDVEFVA